MQSVRPVVPLRQLLYRTPHDSDGGVQDAALAAPNVRAAARWQVATAAAVNRSVFQMLEDLAKFPKDLTDWENGLVSNCLRIAHSDGTSTRRLSDKQVEQINRIWKTHHGQSEE